MTLEERIALAFERLDEPLKTKALTRETREVYASLKHLVRMLAERRRGIDIPVIELPDTGTRPSK